MLVLVLGLPTGLPTTVGAESETTTATSRPDRVPTAARVGHLVRPAVMFIEQCWCCFWAYQHGYQQTLWGQNCNQIWKSNGANSKLVLAGK